MLDSLNPEEIEDAFEEEATSISDDWMMALEPEDGVYEWNIPTGRDDNEGRSVFIPVEVVDPKNPALLTAYLFSEDKEAAGLSLFKACVKTPVAITEEKNYKRLTTAFRQSLTFKILNMLGLNADFLANLERMAAKGQRARKKSSTKSPTGTDSTPAKSESSPQKTSPKPTDTQKSDANESDGTSSPTSDTSSETPSPQGESSTQTPSSKESGTTTSSPTSKRVRIL